MQLPVKLRSDGLWYKCEQLFSMHLKSNLIDLADKIKTIYYLPKQACKTKQQTQIVSKIGLSFSKVNVGY